MAEPAFAGEHIVGPHTADDDVLRVEHIRKRFGPTIALRDVNLHLRKGEVLGLLGDNGAGKSTLIKILCGFQKQDEGTMWLKGEDYQPKSVDDARSARDRHRLPGPGADRRADGVPEPVPASRALCTSRSRSSTTRDAPRCAQGARRDRDQHPARSTCRSRVSRAASVRRSRSRGRSPAMPTSSCSTSRSRRWAPRRAA